MSKSWSLNPKNAVEQCFLEVVWAHVRLKFRTHMGSDKFLRPSFLRLIFSSRSGSRYPNIGVLATLQSANLGTWTLRVCSSMLQEACRLLSFHDGYCTAFLIVLFDLRD